MLRTPVHRFRGSGSPRLRDACRAAHAVQRSIRVLGRALRSLGVVLVRHCLAGPAEVVRLALATARVGCVDGSPAGRARAQAPAPGSPPRNRDPGRLRRVRLHTLECGRTRREPAPVRPRPAVPRTRARARCDRRGTTGRRALRHRRVSDRHPVQPSGRPRAVAGRRTRDALGERNRGHRPRGRVVQRAHHRAIHSGPSRRITIVTLVAIVLGVALLGAGLQDTYLDGRYAVADVGYAASYPMFRFMQHQRVAVGGFAADYPLFGESLTNRVQYIGVSEPNGEFRPPATCTEWLSRLRAGRYDYVVISTSPAALHPQRATRNQLDETRPGREAGAASRRHVRVPPPRPHGSGDLPVAERAATLVVPSQRPAGRSGP